MLTRNCADCPGKQLTFASYRFSASGDGCGEALRGRLGIRCLRDCTHDDDASGTGIEQLGQAFLVDAADREPGTRRCGVGSRSNQFQAGSTSIRFGRRRPDRPGAEVVDALFDGGKTRLRAAARRTADPRAGRRTAGVL